MHILIAPNAFKHSLTADAAALAIEQGLKNSRLSFSSECFPIGDGGDGTAALLIKKWKGTTIDCTVHDALGRKLHSSFGLIDNGNTAVIEMADASGLRLLSADELNPLAANSYGTGEMIKQALDRGIKKIIIGLGGSCTTDGGVGLLKALGIRFLDAAGIDLLVIPEDLVQLDHIDASRIDERLRHCAVTVLCDVDNFMLGAEGAAAVFAPQKGATAAQQKILEAGLQQFAATVFKQTGKDINTVKHAGAAGGTAAGLYAFLQANLTNGIDAFLELTGFEAALQKTDILITGEGSIDEQTLKGKGPFGVASKAKQKNIPVIGLAGKLPLKQSEALQHYFNVLLPIAHEPLTMPDAIRYTADNLTRTSAVIGNLLAIHQNIHQRTGENNTFE